MESLTPKQKQIVQAIYLYTTKHKYPPSVRELCKLVDLKSTSSVHRHLARLKELNVITWEESVPRTVHVVNSLII